MKRLITIILLAGVSTWVAAEDKFPDSSAEGAPPSAEHASAAKSPSVHASTATLSVSSAPAEAVTPPVVQTATPTIKGIIGFPQSQSLSDYHEKEIASLKQFMERWNKEIGTSLQRREETEKSISEANEKINALLNQNTKTSKKEADQLKKDISRRSKDLKSIDKEIKEKQRELSDEIRKMGDDDSRAMEETYRQVSRDIRDGSGR